MARSAWAALALCIAHASVVSAATLNVYAYHETDTVECRSDGTRCEYDSSDLEIGLDTGSYRTDVVGIRFEDVAVPAGSIVHSATIRFEADETSAGSADPLDVTVHGLLEASPFTDVSDTISRRNRTSAQVVWQPEAVTTRRQTFTTNELAPVIAELINGDSWISGSAIAVVLQRTSGTGTRWAEPSGSSGAPMLTIDYSVTAADARVTALERSLGAVLERVQSAESENLGLKGVLSALGRHAMLDQQIKEERVRSQGGSGLTKVRSAEGGPKAYHTANTANYAFANIHDHADHKYTCGMGEVQAVLNGVEFSTRHNDYQLRMAHRNSSRYHDTEYIDAPEVPPSVLAAGSVAAQVDEMREYFVAWATQNSSHRDYAPYFRPTLVYMEGAWVNAGEELTEPFFSDRHSIEAETWQEVHETMRFLSNSGVKNVAENMVNLPQAVRDVSGDAGHIPRFAQFEYRINAHPLEADVPLSRFRPVNDLATFKRLIDHGWDIDELKRGESRAVRYELNQYCDRPHNCTPSANSFSDRRRQYSYVDYLMQQVPGKDNYGANLTDTFDQSSAFVNHGHVGPAPPLNVGYYSRYYGSAQNDAMGRTRRRRSFSDPNMWAAMTTQADVSGVSVQLDNVGNGCNGCDDRLEQKWTYAFPLEIVYMTPLTRWNPYNIIEYSGADRHAPVANGRDGGLTPSTAFNGSSSYRFYRTPAELFEGGLPGDAADTDLGIVGVLDSAGQVQRVVASGHRIHLPEIRGIPHIVRQRYPIAPIHEEGSATWKETKALADIVGDGLTPTLLGEAFQSIGNTPGGGSGPQARRLQLTQGSTGHVHALSLSSADMTELFAGRTVTVTSELRNGHQHECIISRDADGTLSVDTMTPYEDHGLSDGGVVRATNPPVATGTSAPTSAAPTLAPSTAAPVTSAPTGTPTTAAPTDNPTVAPTFHACSSSSSHDCDAATTYCAEQTSSPNGYICACRSGFVPILTSSTHCAPSLAPTLVPTTDAPTPLPTEFPTTAAPQSAAPTGQPSREHRISWGFDVSQATISISTGDTVTWVWDQSGTHNIVSGERATPNNDFTAPYMSSGSFSHTFQTAGRFPYHCSPHASMNAVITVIDGHTTSPRTVATTSSTTMIDPAGPTISQRSCTALGFPFRSVRGRTTTVCGESDQGFSCTRNVDFATAVATCSSIGARMCTADEIGEDVGRGTGCGHDNKPIWTRTECTLADGTSGRLAPLGNSRKQDRVGSVVCVAEDAEEVAIRGRQKGLSVRCCGDRVALLATQYEVAMRQPLARQSGSALGDDDGDDDQILNGAGQEFTAPPTAMATTEAPSTAAPTSNNQGSSSDADREMEAMDSSSEGSGSDISSASVGLVVGLFCVTIIVIIILALAVVRYSRKQGSILLSEAKAASSRDVVGDNVFTLSEDEASLRMVSVHRTNPASGL